MLGVDSEVSHISRHRCELAGLLSHVLVSFPVVLLKHSKIGNLREEGLLLVHPRGQSIAAQESRQQEFEAAGHIASTSRTQRRMN